MHLWHVPHYHGKTHLTHIRFLAIPDTLDLMRSWLIRISLLADSIFTRTVPSHKKIEEPIGETLHFGAPPSEKKKRNRVKKDTNKDMSTGLKEKPMIPALKPQDIPTEHMLAVLPDKFLIMWGAPSLNRVISIPATLQCKPIFTHQELIYAEKTVVHVKKLDARFNNSALDSEKDKVFAEELTLDEEDVDKLLLSPKGEYIVTLARFRGTGNKGNLAIWDRHTGKELWRGIHREHMNGESWPKIVMFYSRRSSSDSSSKSNNEQDSSENNGVPTTEHDEDNTTPNPYADSERVAILTTKQDILFMMRNEEGNLMHQKVYKKKKVRFWSMGAKGHFVVYADGKPGGAYLYDVNSNFKKPLSQIPFVPVESCEIKWNKQGDQVLILTSTAVDDSSYYGTSRLYLMNGKGSYQNAVNIESPIHDAQWSPKGNEFISVYGKTPNCKATLYNQRGQSLCDLGTGPRNNARWNPHGRLFCLAGIRSMQGRLEFWNREKKKMFGLGQAQEASNISWSPSGQYFASSTVSPIMNVSNKIQIFKYNGVLKSTKNFDVKDSALYYAIWQSHPNEKFPDVKPSPRALQEGKNLQTQKKQQGTTGRYVPPHLRK
eukprot:CAMPEP_0117438068 /NCGR_PEP_ID=MMETSP0759-20121206/1860_1 /TAXON_ID=63605 /ORGANISM="Percolomonas cosmopolitus, Strain WS" /LENGTH=601 /DNA_ID=CAMNT_0005229743 /DNA_START=80 /DNA_END=1885 /DNA_ORIENTATION=-